MTRERKGDNYQRRRGTAVFQDSGSGIAICVLGACCRRCRLDSGRYTPPGRGLRGRPRVRLKARQDGVSMTTELVLLGTAGGPIPVAGRAAISSALVDLADLSPRHPECCGSYPLAPICSTVSGFAARVGVSIHGPSYALPTTHSPPSECSRSLRHLARSARYERDGPQTTSRDQGRTRGPSETVALLARARGLTWSDRKSHGAHLETVPGTAN